MSDLLTQKLVPPAQRNTKISYQNIQMCPITLVLKGQPLPSLQASQPLT